MSIPYLAHDGENVVSVHWMEPEAVDKHRQTTGHNLVPIIDPKLADELRLYHQRYKVVDGVIQLRDKAEIDAIEQARQPKMQEGPTRMELLQEEILNEIKAMNQMLEKAFK